MTEMEEELRPCTVCGKPVLWGTRHPVCGQRVMAPGAGVAVTHWMPLPLAAGLDGVMGTDGDKR